MEVYERINLYLKDKKISKKEFAKQLLHSDVKLKNTGDVPSENTIYAYLNGRIGLKIELIPYIAEVLQIPEQLLFDDSSRTRKIYLNHLLKDITSEEAELLKSRLCDEKQPISTVPKDRMHKIQDLLQYAPEMFLQQLENTLKEYKDLTMKFKK
jgi:transcriptional regulator with XRE-family HTH domain